MGYCVVLFSPFSSPEHVDVVQSQISPLQLLYHLPIMFYRAHFFLMSSDQFHKYLGYLSVLVEFFSAFRPSLHLRLAQNKNLRVGLVPKTNVTSQAKSTHYYEKFNNRATGFLQQTDVRSTIVPVNLEDFA